MKKNASATIQMFIECLNKAGLGAEVRGPSLVGFELGAIIQNRELGLPVVHFDFDVTDDEIKAFVGAVHGHGTYAVSADPIVLDDQEPSGFLTLEAALRKYRRRHRKAG